MHTQNNILIVDDTPDNLRLLSAMLNEHGYKVRPAPSGAHALATIKKKKPDLILLDVMMPELDGYEVCQILKSDDNTNKIPIIFLSALDELKDKIKGFNVGGIDYITKPFHESEVMARVETHLKIRNLQVKLQTETDRFKNLAEERLRLLQENSTLKLTIKDRYRFGEIIGRSPLMQNVYQLVTKAASTDFPVMIHGESGTGKELVARTIHKLSDRKDKPFISVNSGAVTESLFEREFFGHRKGAFTGAIQDESGFIGAAHKGTLFLDEIGELPIAMQVKLLRVLESGEYTPVGDIKSKKTDLRIVAATNKNLEELVLQGKFRKDLYYRIKVIDLELPPLRARREDIHLLIEHILHNHNAGDKLNNLPEKLLEMISHYDWPGNVRELKNIIQRYLATDSIGDTSLANFVSNQTNFTNGKLHDVLENLERQIIIDTLKKEDGHRSKTANHLGIPRRSLQRKIIKYNLNSEL